jgi:hypothetical protein
MGLRTFRGIQVQSHVPRVHQARHASSTVEMGTLKRIQKKAVSDSSRSVTPYLAKPKHAAVLEKLERIRERFETSPFNVYQDLNNRSY